MNLTVPTLSIITVNLNNKEGMRKTIKRVICTELLLYINDSFCVKTNKY